MGRCKGGGFRVSPLRVWGETVMTEYEAATLAIREATLNYQFWGIIVSACMPGVGLLGIIWMSWRARKRDKHWADQHEETMQEIRTHRENMKTLIERTAPA